jgi:FkbM family methyltransferase
MRRAVKLLLPPLVLIWLKVLLKYARASRSRLKPADENTNVLRVAHDNLNQNVVLPEIVLRKDLRFRLHPESIEPFLAFCYTYPPMVEEMSEFLKLTADKLRLLDVGALHGVFSLAFVAGNPARQAVAVDASPIAFARLLYNIHHNASGKVVPVECALSSQTGTVQMHYEWEHAVAAGTNGTDGVGVMKMACKRGDELCGSLAYAPDVIKIDVEGHEIKVLKGLEATILASAPLIFLEIHPLRIKQEQDSIETLLKMLERWRYEARFLDGRRAETDDLVHLQADERVVLQPLEAN